MKRIIFFLLAVSLVLTCLAPMASATETEATETTEAPIQREYGQCGEDMTWEYSEGILTITGNGPMDDFPDGPQWAQYKDVITEVKLVGSISTIGANAFTDYDNLISVSFGNALQEIGVAAFMNCDGLTSITLPDTFRRFGEDSFRSCSNLNAIHCSGGFPSFNLNCLWNTWCNIYFPVNRPWSVVYIQQLEEAFKGRIEFLASDGSDPYVPTEPTEATVPETTEATEETVPETTEPSVTEAPTEAPTQPVTEAPTQPATESPATQAPQPETSRPTEPQDVEDTARGSFGGLLLVSGVLCLLILGALLFRRRKY